MDKTQLILKLLEDLVQIKSVSTNTTKIHEVIDYADQHLSNEKIIIERFESNGFPSLIIRPKAKGNRKNTLVLYAHLDVVPGDDSLFVFTQKGEKAFGRGVYDMKGSAAVILQLFHDLVEENKIQDNVILTLVTDEEIGGHDGVKAMLNKKSISCDFFLAGEPTNLHICTKQKGVLWLEVIQRGLAAHGSLVWEGRNANVELAQKIAAFYKTNPIPEKETDKTTYNMSLLQGGTGKNIVSETATAFFDIRRNANDDPEKIISSMKAVFSNAEIKVIMNESALITDENHPMIVELAHIAKKHSTNTGNIVSAHFASDGRFYSEIGIPAINFGVIGGGMHQRDEWVDIKSFQLYYDILKEFVLLFG